MESFRFNIHSLKVKMILAVILCFIIVILITIANNVIAARIIWNKTNTSVIHTIEQTNRYLSFLFKKAEELSHTFSLNTNIEKLAAFEDPSSENYYAFFLLIKDVEADVMNQAELNSEIDSIYLYINNIDYMITSRFGLYSFNFVSKSHWIRNAFSFSRSKGWIDDFYDERFSEQDMMIFFSRVDKLNDDIDSPVYMSINFSKRMLLEIINVLKVTSGSLVFLINHQDKIILNDNQQLIGRSLYELYDVQKDELVEKKMLRIKLADGNHYRAIYRDNDIINGGLLVFIPENEMLSEQNRLWKYVILLSALMSVVFVLFIHKAVIVYVDQPVTQLVCFMRKAESGQFEEQITDARKDEFGYLYRSYNRMIDKINRLIHQLYHQKILKTEMELKVLQAQINPHFLFNTLDNINWIAEKYNVRQISDIVVSLSNMYKITFNDGNDLIKISRLVEGIRSYLCIQQVRLGNSFRYSIDISDDIADCLVLNLVVQTIVENAVIHGISEKRENGLVGVSAYAVNNMLHFIIQDNGMGMGEEKLALLRNIIASRKIAGDSGLVNVQKRIRLFYGEQYGIEIDSQLNKGTRILIKLAVLRDNLPADKHLHGKEEEIYD